MTGKERITLAFQHKEGDRVPIYEQAFASDVASEILGRKVFTGSTSLHYEEAKAWMHGEGVHNEFEKKVWEDTVALTEYFEFDAIDMPWRITAKPTQQIDKYTFLYGDKNRKNGYAIYCFDPCSQTFGVFDSSENHLQPDDIPKHGGCQTNDGRHACKGIGNYMQIGGS